MTFHRLGLTLNREVGRGYAPSKTPLPPRLRKERGIQGVRLIHKNQRGFTLVELLVAIAITAFITGGITMVIFQVFSGNARSSNHMIAVRQVQNAGFWISQDAQMAQTVLLEWPEEDPPGTRFPLSLSWTEWDGTRHQVIYTLENMTDGDKQLQRQHLTYDVVGNPIGDETSIVARYIIPGLALTSLDYTAGVLTFTVTASVGNGSQEESETRVYEITPRTSI